MFLLLALLIEKAGNVKCSLALDERTLCGLCFCTKKKEKEEERNSPLPGFVYYVLMSDA